MSALPSVCNQCLRTCQRLQGPWQAHDSQTSWRWFQQNQMLIPSRLSVSLSNAQASPGSYFTTYLCSPALGLHQGRMKAFQVKTPSGTPRRSVLAVFRGKGKCILQKGSSAAPPVLYDVPWKSLSMQAEKFAPSESVHYTARILLEPNFWGCSMAAPPSAK